MKRINGTNRATERRLRVAGLFAGIGGIERGLDRAGHCTEFMCEIDPAARAVLERRFPGVPLESDVRAVHCLPRGIDLLTAGFPCQDLSQVGRTRGIHGRKSGLVKELLRLLADRPVPWVLIENVPFMLSLGKGAAIRMVVSELEKLGYEWAYRVIDSRAFGIPQRRRRVFLLASLEGSPASILFANDTGPPPDAEQNGHACGFYWTEGNKGVGWAQNALPTLKGGSARGQASSPAIWFPESGRIETPDVRDAERLQGFPANWTLPAESVNRRSYRWTLIGNAVTVQAALWVGKKLLGDEGSLPDDVDELPRSGGWPAAAFGSSRRRLAVKVSDWPCRRTPPDLRDFLRFETQPLSERATRGFATRLGNSRLNYSPKFMEDLWRHVSRMEGANGS